MREGPLKFAEVKDAFFDFTESAELDPTSKALWDIELSKPLSSPLADIEEEDPFRTLPSRVDRLPVVEPEEGMQLRSTRNLHYAKTAAANYVADSYAEFCDIYGGFMWETHTANAAKVTVGTALKSQDKVEWLQAIREEVRQLLSGTLKAVNDCDIIGKHRVIHTTMQLKHKLHQDLTTDKWKARLCACGNELFGLVAETYSPTIGALAYSTVHQIAIIDRMKRITVDTVGAFLTQFYPDDAEPLYVVFPGNVATALNLDPNQKYRVLKYIYGLPDAGVAFYRAYAAHLIAKGYVRTRSDPCLFVKIEGGVRTYVWTHVDDTFVCSTHQESLDRYI
jgi:hypothetical protein